LKSVSVCLSVSLGDDEVGHCPADCLVSRPAENACGTIIPIGHDAVRLHDNHCIKCGFQHQAQGDRVWRAGFCIGSDCHGFTKLKFPHLSTAVFLLDTLQPTLNGNNIIRISSIRNVVFGVGHWAMSAAIGKVSNVASRLCDEAKPAARLGS
jgi:hypothetical protein